MDPSELTRLLTDYIVAEVAMRPLEDALTPDYPIVESGLVDSLGLFKVISFIEEELAIEIAPEDIVIENFVTVGAIVAFVGKNRHR